MYHVTVSVCYSFIYFFILFRSLSSFPEDAHHAQPLLHPDQRPRRRAGPQPVRLAALGVQEARQRLTWEILLPLGLHVRGGREPREAQHLGEPIARAFISESDQSCDFVTALVFSLHLKNAERYQQLRQLPLHQEPEAVQQHHTGQSAGQRLKVNMRWQCRTALILCLMCTKM